MIFTQRYRINKLRRKYGKLYSDLISEVCEINWHSTSNEESLEILKRFLAKYKTIPPDNVVIEVSENIQSSLKGIMYTRFFLGIDCFFLNGEITKAGTMLDSLIRHFPIFQVGLKANLTKLLEKYLN